MITAASLFALSLATVALAAPAGVPDSPALPLPATPPAPPAVERVGGDMNAPLDRTGDVYRSGPCVINTPLPEGYPPPTPPGAIEIKRYPSVRRAEVTGDTNPDIGMNFAFWPLFQHIQRNNIAMTAPVEMDYKGLEPAAAGQAPGKPPESWTMSFLYRTRDLHEVGEEGKVRIVDTQPVTVLSIGVRGPFSYLSVQQSLAQLDEWLDAHPQWRRAGEPRALGNHGPDVPRANVWSEAQLPIEPAPPAQAAQSAPASPANDGAP